MKIPIGGGPATLLASADNTPQRIAVDAANVYCTTRRDHIKNAGRDSVMRVPLAGGDPTTVDSSGDGHFGIAVNGSSVTWTEDGRVMTAATLSLK